MDTKEVMRQALDALEQIDPYVDQLVCYASTQSEWPLNSAPKNVAGAIEALRTALAQPEQAQPTGWAEADALAILRMDSDASYGQSDVDSVLSILRDGDKLRGQKLAQPQVQPEPNVWSPIQIASWIGTQLQTEPSMFERGAVIKFVRSLGRHPTLQKHAAPQPPAAEPMIQAMSDVADTFAHKLALDLECVLADYSGKWYDTAMKTIGAYRSAMNAIHEQESPTFMGEPVIQPPIAQPAKSCATCKHNITPMPTPCYSCTLTKYDLVNWEPK